MTKDETLKVLAILKAAYPSSYNNMTKREANGTVAVWSFQFANMPMEVVLIAVYKLISTNKFPPSISEVKDKIQSISWEAYNVLSKCRNGTMCLPADTLAQYEMIYEATKHLQMTVKDEPTISQMLMGGQMLQLGTGD